MSSFVHVYIYIHTYIQTCMCVYICIYIYIHIHSTHSTHDITIFFTEVPGANGLSANTSLATQGAANQQTHLPNLPPGGSWRGLDGRTVAVRMIPWSPRHSVGSCCFAQQLGKLRWKKNHVLFYFVSKSWLCLRTQPPYSDIVSSFRRRSIAPFAVSYFHWI